MKTLMKISPKRNYSNLKQNNKNIEIAFDAPTALSKFLSGKNGNLIKVICFWNYAFNDH